MTPALRVLDELLILVNIIEEPWLESLKTEAQSRLLHRDPQDWPILATALLLDCPIWPEDTDFFGVGVPTWTTTTVHHYLSSEQSKSR